MPFPPTSGLDHVTDHRLLLADRAMLRFHLLAIPLLTLALASGCSHRTPAEQATQLADEITTLRAGLPADPTADEAPVIAKPAKRAARAYTALQELQTRNPADPAVAAARTAAEPAAIEIRRIHRLATERHDLSELMGGLKVRAYRATRTVVVPRLLDTLAAAARQAADADFAKLPRFVREGATVAAQLADVWPTETTAENEVPPLTRADWLRAAEQLETFNRAEPAELSLGLGIAYGALGKSSFALVELDRATAGQFSEPEYADIVPLVRALVYSRLGFTELATREITRLSGDTEQGRQLLALGHLTIAYLHSREKDWKQVDRSLGEAVRIWPNNPLVVYLSGERLLADGSKEQALETFAKAANSTDAAWIAPLLEKRVRSVRDSRGDAPPLFLDNGFLVESTLRLLFQEIRRKATGQKLARFLDTAQQLPALLDLDKHAAPAVTQP